MAPPHIAEATLSLAGVPVLVVGAGIMGAGIAQVAAQAGHRVHLFDVRAGAAEAARVALAATWDKLVNKGKLTPEAAQAALARIVPVDVLEDAPGAREARLVIEAVAEDLEIKRALFRTLEALMPADAVLATNTSSISVTALASALQTPERVVGMHFFNPVPLMKLVEVVSGLLTAPAVAQAVFALGQAWGKVPVHARSTPGFIVNRIARPFYAETWALLQERATLPETIDAYMRGAGFRMGPCALMDMIGHDVNLAVTKSVYQAFHGDKRYQPSLLQTEMVEGGLLGQKSGRGFYAYRAGSPSAATSPGMVVATPKAGADLAVHGSSAQADIWARTLSDAGYVVHRWPHDDHVGLSIGHASLRLTDGRTATQLASVLGTTDVAVFDLPLGAASDRPALAYGVSATSDAAWDAQARQWLWLLGYQPMRVADTPGLVAARTVAMIVNEAAEAVLQGVCTEDAVDSAMKLGVSYPAGPFEWLKRWGAAHVVALLDHLDAHYRGERYRASPALRQRAWMSAA